MAQRRPIASHPAFAPLVALWFAALFGLAVAVVPGAVLGRLLGTMGTAGAGPLTLAGRLGACAVAALIGAAIGLALGRMLARRAQGGPRPLWDEQDIAMSAPPPPREAARRRPLRIREEFPDADIEDEEGRPNRAAPSSASESLTHPAAAIRTAGAGEFMILSPPRVARDGPAAGLDDLLAQFDTAIDAFGHEAGDPLSAPHFADDGPDPVQAFVARQTAPQGAGQSPLGGHAPDHQAALRIALDKLAHFRRGEG